MAEPTPADPATTDPTPDENWTRLGKLIEDASEKAAQKVLGEWASKNNSSQTSGSTASPAATPPKTDPPKKGFLEKLITG